MNSESGEASGKKKRNRSKFRVHCRGQTNSWVRVGMSEQLICLVKMMEVTKMSSKQLERKKAVPTHFKCNAKGVDGDA